MSFFFVFRLNTFTSKVSNLRNLLLPLEAEGAECFESYPTSEMPNKYIYDALFTYFTVVVFSLSGTSKELIEDSQRL